MTNNEIIIKALMCCNEAQNCTSCKFEPTEYPKGTVGCCDELMKNAIDLIKRQQAEIAKAKSEAITEFAERLIQETRTFSEYDEGGWECDVSAISAEDIDRIAKEMTEGDNGA